MTIRQIDPRRRITDVLARLDYPGYSISLDDEGRLDIRTYHPDVQTGQPKEFGWRVELPVSVWKYAHDRGWHGELSERVCEVVYAELVREAAHEIAERLRWDGLLVVDPHPDEDLGDGVGSAAVAVRFASGRQR